MRVETTVVRRPSRPVLVGWLVALTAGVMFDASAAVLTLLAAAAGWAVVFAEVRIVGGGFRPLRSSDLIDFVALDDLDAFDRAQAAKNADRRQRSFAMQRGRR